jgi:hypothetical protein
MCRPVRADDDDILRLSAHQAMAQLVDGVRDRGRRVALEIPRLQVRRHRGAVQRVDLDAARAAASTKLELVERLSGGIRHCALLADQHRDPGRRRRQDRRGDARLPVVVRDDGRRLERPRLRRGRVGGERSGGGIGDWIGPADSGRVAGGDKWEAEGAHGRLLGVVGGDRDRHHAGLAPAVSPERIDRDQQRDQRDQREAGADQEPAIDAGRQV